MPGCASASTTKVGKTEYPTQPDRLPLARLFLCQPQEVAYRKAGYSKKFLAEHEPEIILHKAAKQFFDEQGLKKLPTVKSLQTEYAQLLSEKKAMYADYQKAREDMRSLQTAKANVDRILGDDSLTAERETEKYGR